MADDTHTLNQFPNKNFLQNLTIAIEEKPQAKAPMRGDAAFPQVYPEPSKTNNTQTSKPAPKVHASTNKYGDKRPTTNAKKIDGALVFTETPKDTITARERFSNLNNVNYESFHIERDFLTPSDSFSFKVDASELNEDEKNLFFPGALVNLKAAPDELSDINAGGDSILWGRVDTSSLSVGREGSFIEVHGRGILADVCDTALDPWSNNFHITEGTTAGALITKVFDDFYKFKVLISDKLFNVAITSGSTTYTVEVPKYNPPLLKPDGYVSKTYPIKHKTKPKPNILSEAENQDPDYILFKKMCVNDPSLTKDVEHMGLKECKPEHNETAYQFAERTALRFHQHIWASPNIDEDGRFTVFVSSPWYKQDPKFSIINKIDDKTKNNVIHVSLNLNYSNQPSLIIGKGLTDSGDINSSTLRCAKINELIGYAKVSQDADQFAYPSAAVADIIGSYKKLKPMKPNRDLEPYKKYFAPAVNPRVIYHYDKRAKTQAELESTISRLMSEHMKHAFVIVYKVQGLGQNGKAYAPNTIVTVDDQVIGISDKFWCQTVTHIMSRHEGTTTELRLIPLYMLNF